MNPFDNILRTMLFVTRSEPPASLPPLLRQHTRTLTAGDFFVNPGAPIRTSLLFPPRSLPYLTNRQSPHPQLRHVEDESSDISCFSGPTPTRTLWWPGECPSFFLCAGLPTPPVSSASRSTRLAVCAYLRTIPWHLPSSEPHISSSSLHPEPLPVGLLPLSAPRPISSSSACVTKVEHRSETTTGSRNRGLDAEMHSSQGQKRVAVEIEYLCE
ncbi:hypothetical protein R3P38DRAFT_3287353 [Favolaschia claudopus]|uniref:Uncharacterized protein n=1 Tax=Favolaschia claudopus TaxID=2862362 RepID=A0AAW0A0U9_9AGAR